MHIYRLIVTAALMLTTIPAFAQDDICTREAVVASFAEASAAGEVEAWAQRYAISDCPAPIKEGARALAEAHITLGSEGAEALALENTYTSPQGYTFRYPNGWFAQPDRSNTLVLSNSQKIIGSQSNLDTLPTGVVMALVTWGTPEDLDLGVELPPDADPSELLQATIASSVDPVFEFGKPYVLPLGTQDAAAVAGRFYENETLFIVFALDEPNISGFMLSIAAPGEMVTFAPTFKAIAASAALQTGPVQSTVPTERWTLAGAEPLLEDVGISMPVLSPDGSMLAGWDRGTHALCIYAFADAEPSCVPSPENGIPSIHYLTWSPDGAQVAFTPNFFQFFHEPDLWLYDLESGDYTNLTPDGVDKFELEGNPAMLLDIAPAWNPATGDLYFFRSQRLEESATLELFRLAPGSEAPALVRDLSHDLPEGFPVWQPPAFSPDGAQMAFLVSATKHEDPANGIWLLDLETDTLEQILPYAGFARAGVPDWYDESYLPIPREIVWAGGGLVFSAIDPKLSTNFGPGFYYLNTETREVTPLVDLSDVPDQAGLFESEGGEPAAIYRVPRFGIVSPEGGSFFYVHYERTPEDAGVSALPLPPDGSAPALLDEIGFKVGGARGEPPYLTAAKENGRAVVIYHNLLTFESADEAAAAAPPPQETAESPFMEMLALVPSAAIASLETPLPLSYVNYGEVLAAAPASQEWMHAYIRLAVGPPELQRSFAYAEESREVVGFSLLEIEQGLQYGEPPSNVSVFAGPFDADAIGEALAAREYAAQDVQGVTVWARADGEPGTSMDPTSRNMADPFGGYLGRKQPVAVLPGDVVYVASSPDDGQVAALAGAAQGSETALADIPLYRMLAEAAAVPGGTLLQALVINPYYMPEAVADFSGITEEAFEQMPQFHQSFAPEWCGYGDMPLYERALLADRQEGDEQIAVIVLDCGREEDAQAAAEELAARLESFTNAIVIKGTEAPLFKAMEPEVRFDAPAVYIDPETGQAAAVVAMRYPMPSAEPDESGLRRNAGGLFRQMVNSLYQRAFYPLWQVSLADWMVETYCAAP